LFYLGDDRPGRRARVLHQEFQPQSVVEPVAAVLGAAAVMIAQPILPYALSFAAGAMIFVVVEELIPESQRGGNTDLATMGAMAGFVVMMILDVAFG